MKIALDVGHMGKLSSPMDRGAVYNNTKESNLVLLYATSAMTNLEKNGNIVYLLTYDDYSHRFQFCEKAKVDLHIQCHLNAAGGDYGIIFHNGIGRAMELSEILSKNLQKSLKLTKVTYQLAMPSDRAYNCLVDTIPSLVLEPMFLDNPTHYRLLVSGDALFTIGKTISSSIITWGGEIS